MMSKQEAYYNTIGDYNSIYHDFILIQMQKELNINAMPFTHGLFPANHMRLEMFEDLVENDINILGQFAHCHFDVDALPVVGHLDARVATRNDRHPGGNTEQITVFLFKSLLIVMIVHVHSLSTI